MFQKNYSSVNLHVLFDLCIDIFSFATRFALLSLILSIYVAFLFIFRYKIENNQTSVYWYIDELCLYCMFMNESAKNLVCT